MENKKLIELKAEAKKLGLKRYSKLRKHELIDLIRNILDQPVPELSQRDSSQREEIRENEEMLGLRKTNIPEKKITNPEEEEIK